MNFTRSKISKKYLYTVLFSTPSWPLACRFVDCLLGVTLPSVHCVLGECYNFECNGLRFFIESQKSGYRFVKIF